MDNKEWPLTDCKNPAIKVSELINQLQKLMDDHGDLPVYCAIDYDYVDSAEYEINSERIRINN